MDHAASDAYVGLPIYKQARRFHRDRGSGNPGNEYHINRKDCYIARSSAMKSPMRTQLIPRRHWVITTAGCCDYVDSTGNNPCFPMFCPMAVFGTCCIAGRVQTQLTNEEPTSCEMGKNGWFTCCIGLPFVFFGPLGGYINCLPRLRAAVAPWHCGPTVLYGNACSSTPLTY